jgi:tetratricopeptide (TPR) repeat protein
MSRPRTLLTVLLAVVVALVVLGVWVMQQRLPGPGSPRYEEYVDLFQVGLAAVDADVPQIAEEKLSKAVAVIPEEPAGWADRGLVYLRQGQLKEAAHDLEEAQRLAPENHQVRKLLGILEQRRERYAEAAYYLRQTIEHDPNDLESLYLLGEVVEQEHKDGGEAEHQRLLEQILKLRPHNLRVLTDCLRLAVRRSDEKAVQGTLATLKELSPAWSEQSQKELAKVEQKLSAKLGPSAVTSTLGLSNLLKAEPGFPHDADEVSPKNELAGEPLQTFLRLAPVRPAPAPPDTGLSFAAEPLLEAPDGQWHHALAVWLTGEGEPVVFVANENTLRQVGGETELPLPAKTTAVTPIDWNNDRRTDLIASGENGIRFFKQQENGGFEDVSDKLGLADDVLAGSYQGALAADVDLDGDMDLILARVKDSPLFLRNNFDGTFTPKSIFEGTQNAHEFVWADFDADGAPDAAMLDEKWNLRVFANERSASFVPWPVAPPDGQFRKLTVMDANDDGVLDIVALRLDGALLSISDDRKRASWKTVEINRWELLAKDPNTDQVTSVELLTVADLDNNGALDLVASGDEASAIWLKDHKGKFQELRGELPVQIQAAADLRGSGRIDLLALDGAGKPVRLVNSGKKTYHWQNVRPQATEDKAEGDNRINSFGIGGEIELRTGTHVVKQPIDAPVVHFGLGERKRSDVLRIVWPNGTFQAEFETPIDKAVKAVQRLKGSCPFLFAFAGERMAFVSDFMWSTPLGMYVNATDQGGFLQTTDWVKIAGEQLAARDGMYELRVNANLWETHFFDHLALMVVDHPEDTEMFVDERFFMQPTEPAFRLMEPPQTVAAARDHEGRDALAEVAAVDAVYLDRCGRGVYQGLTQNHWVDFELGEDAQVDGPLWLVARGWVHPTDSSINYALAQGNHEPPRALTLEVPDGQGGWKVGRDRLGFLAGKNKTMLIRLDGLQESDDGGMPRRFRLRTNMEIYWDWLAYARGRDDVKAKQQRLLPQTAELRFRGIVAMTQANRSSPELPDYDRLISVGQHWRDLTGYHTRFGDIRELLETVDDRYAILTAGDEILLKFAAPADPSPGWKRDFVWVSDGWVKDGDYNTRFGKTVLPLPCHDMTDYTTLPGSLEDDPVYRRHQDDWEVYHTRYVTPDAFEQGLRGFRAAMQKP